MLDHRPHALGKFIFTGDKKLYIRGVTYGPFRPDLNGDKYHNPEVVERDFAQIAANGLNAVRTYTVPPRWLLDAAEQHGLRVMVGLPVEREAMFLDDRKHTRSLARSSPGRALPRATLQRRKGRGSRRPRYLRELSVH